MRRLLRQLDRQDRRGRSARSGRLPTVIAASLSLTLAVTLTASVLVVLAWREPDAWQRVTSVWTTSSTRESKAADTVSDGAFAWSLSQPGDPSAPVGYSPCRPIRIVVNDALAPLGSDGLVAEALMAVENASGLRFTVLGTTRDQPASRKGADAGRLVDGHALPALVVWTTPSVVPRLRGRTAGLGAA